MSASLFSYKPSSPLTICLRLSVSYHCLTVLVCLSDKVSRQVFKSLPVCLYPSLSVCLFSSARLLSDSVLICLSVFITCNPLTQPNHGISQEVDMIYKCPNFLLLFLFLFLCNPSLISSFPFFFASSSSFLPPPPPQIAIEFKMWLEKKNS